MPRPTVALSLRVAPEVSAALIDQAAAENMSSNALAERTLREYLLNEVPK